MINWFDSFSDVIRRGIGLTLVLVLGIASFTTAQAQEGLRVDVRVGPSVILSEPSVFTWPRPTVPPPDRYFSRRGYTVMAGIVSEEVFDYPMFELGIYGLHGRHSIDEAAVEEALAACSDPTEACGGVATVTAKTYRTVGAMLEFNVNPAFDRIVSPVAGVNLGLRARFFSLTSASYRRSSDEPVAPANSIVKDRDEGYFLGVQGGLRGGVRVRPLPRTFISLTAGIRAVKINSDLLTETPITLGLGYTIAD